MIELVNREMILAQNKIFASFVIDLQKVKYDPYTNGNWYEPGDRMYVEDEKQARAITKEESDLWNKQALEEYEKNRDKLTAFSSKESFAGSLIYYVKAKDIDNYVLNIADTITEMAIRLNWYSVFFLLDYSIPWLYQDNDFMPVKKALAYFKKLGVDQKFNGGFKVDATELKEFIRNLFWIIRCNGELPDCYFFPINKKFICNICKYGNVHFEFYSEEEKNELRIMAQNIGLGEIENGQCGDHFSESGRIEGREIIV